MTLFVPISSQFYVCLECFNTPHSLYNHRK